MQKSFEDIFHIPFLSQQLQLKGISSSDAELSFVVDSIEVSTRIRENKIEFTLSDCLLMLPN